MEAKEIIGIDIGQKHTGIARASTVAKIAEPLKTVPTENLIDELGKMLQASRVSMLVVGLPRNLDGQDTPQTKWLRGWVLQAKTKLEVPMFWVDEALTSKLQEPKGKKPATDHELAATTILQDFINTPQDARQPC